MVGGMEKLSFALAKEFTKNVDTTLITWGKSQKYLPYFLPYAFLKSLYIIPIKRINHLHIGDALLSPLALVLKKIFHIKTTVTVAGLDITWNFPGYQLLVPKCVAQLDKVFCISNATLEECVKRGIPREKCIMIPCGVYPEDFIVKATRSDLEKIVGEKLTDKKVLITVGRLVKRKGVYWFIENVLPKLDKNIIYLVIGDGPERERIVELIHKLNFENRVKLLGKIPDKDLKIIYNTADLFIMPNIKVDNNIEGFGIVAIEASSTGLPVIASNLEGMKDSIIQNRTGILINDSKPIEMLNAIKTVSLSKDMVKKITLNNYSWGNIGFKYTQSFTKL